MHSTNINAIFCFLRVPLASQLAEDHGI